MGRLMGDSNRQLWRVRFWHESPAGLQLGLEWFGGPYLNRNVAVREGRRKAMKFRNKPVSPLTRPEGVFLRWQVQVSEPVWADAEGDSASG